MFPEVVGGVSSAFACSIPSVGREITGSGGRLLSSMFGLVLGMVSSFRLMEPSREK